MKTKAFINFKTFLMFLPVVFFFGGLRAQSNVFDNIISQSPAHTYLTAAITQQNLAGALQDPNASLTVFAPTDQAFDQLAAALNTDIAGLLALPNLTDVLLYHVLGSTAASTSLSNGMLVTPLNNSNTIKVSITSNGVFANHAQVTTADIIADNGVVHVIDEVILPNLTVVDLAINNNFTILTTAVIQQGLVPTLSNPFASFTVLAPTDAAFTALLDGLGITAAQLLELDNLTDILLYHVFNSEIEAADLSNGLLAQPLNNDNTIKVTVKGNGDVFFNQAQVVLADVNATNGIVHALDNVILPGKTVVDVAIDNAGFTVLTTAVIQQELLPVLTNPLATFTVLAPTDAAFTALLDGLGITAAQLLELDNLTDILLYHVFNSEIEAADLSNGLLAQPLNNDNTIKVTVKGNGDVFFNQAQVVLADVTATNGIVHALDNVILPGKTVVDVAIDNAGFTVLTTAVIQQELLPVLTNPLATFTVLAPTDAAFTALLDGLGITAAQLLELDNLTDILLYHVFNSEIEAADLSNGLLAQPLNNDNTIKVTVKGNGDVFFNQAQVVLADVMATNGIVHALNNVILPVQTVVDVAINNGFTILTTALIQEELVPTLTNPLSQFTVFAPTNAAFEALAALINTNIEGVLELDELANVLLYHVAPGALQAAQLTNGPLTMVSGEQAIINIDGGVTINEANVVTANVLAFNGVVHVIDQVIIPGTTSIQSFDNTAIVAYPNPASGSVQLDGINNAQLSFVDLTGAKVFETNYNGNPIDINNLNSGVYFIYVTHEQKQHVVRLTIK